MHAGMKRLILVVVLLCFSLAVLSVAIPKRINYQGVLKNKSTGQILPDGNYSVTFRLYTVSSGGSAVWSETTTVTITNGILNYQLGSAVTLNLVFDQTYYLGIQVSGDSEMTPRERLTSVGYAYRAANADNADNATNATNVGGLGLAELDTRFLNASGGDTWTGLLNGTRTSSGYVLQLTNYGTGQAMYARSSSSNPTIYTEQYGSGRAISGYNYADNYGTGIGGLSFGLNGIGVYGYAPRGIGVYGYSTATAAIVAVNGGVNGNALYAESDNWWNTLEVKNTSSGRGIYAESASYTGIKGVSKGDYCTGIAGEANGTNGYGVYGSAPSGIGVYGYTMSSTYAIYGDNERTDWYGSGVYGLSKAQNGSGVLGNGYFGVQGNGSFMGVLGISPYYGVYGVATATIGGYGVWANSAYIGAYVHGDERGLLVNSDSGYAIYAYSTGANKPTVYTHNDGAGYALYAESSMYRGAYIKSGGSYYGLFVQGSGSFGASISGDLLVNGNISATGSKAGYVVDYCKNSGTGTLEPGDIVVIQGSSAAILGEIPVMLVAKTNTAYNTAVVGVVNRGITIGSNAGEPATALGAESGEKDVVVQASATAVIEPSQYVSVVTLGAYQAIKVDASFSAIQPGDLLVTSTNPGYAMKAQAELINGKPFYPSGCIIGKALGTLESGQGTIPVFVGHQ